MNFDWFNDWSRDQILEFYLTAVDDVKSMTHRYLG